MKKLILLLVLLSFMRSSPAQKINYAGFVNPMIGTGGHGHTFPGAALPFGMVQLSPDTRIDGSWDGCSGYHYSDSVIYGFSHTHLSGTGCSDYGDIALLPIAGVPAGFEFDYRKYALKFSHSRERATAGYYSVLSDNGINAELTATTRVGLHKYTFPEGSECSVDFQLDHRDKTIESGITIINDHRVVGFRRSEAWAKDQYIFFVAEFSKSFAAGPSKKDKVDGRERVLFQLLNFGRLKENTLTVKVAISNVSVDGAIRNLEAEAAGWDFEQYAFNAAAAWNKELSCIQVSADPEQMTIFYSALYHTMLQPNVAMDVNGKYRGRDNKIHKAENFTYYTVFSLWDTFRAANPLYTLIEPERTSDFINTFIAQYEQAGRLPVWELAGNETDCMIGYHAVSVIADAMAKNIQGFDYEKAYEACRNSAMTNLYGLPAYRKNGFISMDDDNESVSKTLEYSYDDFCIAQMAKILGKENDYKYFLSRSQSWKNVFDAGTGFMRPKKNGGWLTPFDPREVNNNFTEGNSWQYSFFVPQDIPGLITAMGGDQKFAEKLDSLFMSSSKTTGREQADITGLIGQYAHGNEPSHHMAWLYSFAGHPEKTDQRIAGILTTMYHNSPDGLAGNEDCGQMSAWYVLSSIGLYQVCPGIPEWTSCKPLFNNVVIRTKAGDLRPAGMSQHTLKTFGISVNNALSKNKYNAPEILPVPAITGGAKVFDSTAVVSFSSGSKVYFSATTPGKKDAFASYQHPFQITETTSVRCFAKDDEKQSDTVTAVFYKRPNNWNIKILSKYNSQYSAGGDKGLIDGLHGDLNWRKGEWQGYQSADLDCVVDLGTVQNLTSISAEFLQDTRAWILMPAKVEFYLSADNKDFHLAATVENSLPPQDYAVQIRSFSASLPAGTAGRFVRIRAVNYGKLPEWHAGAGGDAFIFADEITVH